MINRFGNLLEGYKNWQKTHTRLPKKGPGHQIAHLGHSVHQTCITVCEDHEGNCVGASSIALNGLTDVPTFDAVVCLEAQALALDLLASRVCIASDSKLVIQDTEANMGEAHAAVIKEVNDRKMDFQD